MKTIISVNPLKAGKLKEYKAFSAENTGHRKREYADLLHRYGLRNTKVYYHRLGDREFIIVMHDAEDDVKERLAHFASSKNPYDQWFNEQLKKLHDFDGEPFAQLLFEFDPKKANLDVH